MNNTYSQISTPQGPNEKHWIKNINRHRFHYNLETYRKPHLLSEGHHCSVKEVLANKVVEIEAVPHKTVVHFARGTLVVESAVFVTCFSLLSFEGV